MPDKKHRSSPDLQSILVEMRAHSILLEDIRAQNSATIEAVEASRSALEQRIDRLDQRVDRIEPRMDRLDHLIGGLEPRLERLDQEGRSRDAGLELAIRDLKVGVQELGVDLRDFSGRVEALSRLEARVAALERRVG